MKKSAFTLIEVIMVIVILSIVGTFTSEIILNIYRSYVTSRSILELESKTKLLLEQVNAYLEKAIQPSIALYDRDGFNGVYYRTIDEISQGDGNLSTITGSSVWNANSFVWVAKDIESLQGIWSEDKKRVYPGYSGIALIEQSSKNTIKTVDNNLSFAEEIQKEILGVSTLNSAIYFRDANAEGDVTTRFWSTNPSSIFQIQSVDESNNSIEIKTSYHKEIGDIYYLSYSAYEISYSGNYNEGNLTISWKIEPWRWSDLGATNHDSPQVTKESFLLSENIAEFNIWSESAGTTLRTRVCSYTPQIRAILEDNSWKYCKEGVLPR